MTRFRHREIPEDIPEVRKSFDGATIPIKDLLMEVGLVSSGSEARRMIQSGAVTIGSEHERKKVTDFRQEITLSGEIILKLGKRKICRVIFQRKNGK